ncbi:MAG: 1,2-phenylacetyl-CoA epoxidase subunit PaaC [Xanthomonadales bacterium]
MRPTNLLVIMSDQHSRQVLGCYGHPLVKTPHLDRLAARGTRFSDAYTNSPICVPARAAFATGRYPHQIRHWDNAHPYHGGVPSWGHLPIGDFADTMARQFLVDVYDVGFYTGLMKSTDETLAAIAAKAIKESRYHLRRSEEWVKRLGDGTGESHHRIQRAFNNVWGYTHELFEVDKIEQSLITAGIAVDRPALKADWERYVQSVLNEATLDTPDGQWSIRGGRQGIHTEHLGYLLAELQFMQRAYPGLEW